MYRAIRSDCMTKQLLLNERMCQEHLLSLMPDNIAFSAHRKRMGLRNYKPKPNSLFPSLMK